MIVFVFVLVSTTMFSQIKDSIDIAQQKQIDNIYLRMFKHDKQFRTGTALISTGLLITAISYLSVSGKDYGYNYKNAKIVAGIGLGFITAGFVFHIDSHKYFNKIW